MISSLSDSKKTWIAREQDRPAGMEIQLLKETIVLPWSQFLYAEGDDEKINLAFSTHGISISGAGLRSLLTDLCGQRVSLLREPVRAERLASDPGLRITSILIQQKVD
jgi:hypothetical protein